MLPYLEWQRLARAAAKLVPTSGIVDGVRAVKDAEEIAKIARAAKIADRGLEALTAETWIGRSERELAWRLRELLHAHGADELSFESIVASGPNGALPHAHPTDRIVETRTLVTVDWGVRVDGYCSDCTRTFSTGSLAGPASRGLRRLSRGAEAGVRRHPRRPDRGRGGRARARPDHRGRASARTSATGSATASACWCTRRRGCRPSRRTRSRSATSSRSSRGSTCPGVGGVRIEDLAVVRDDGVELLTSFPKAADRSRLATPGAPMAEVVSTNQFRNGMHIELEGQTWRIVEFQHVKPGKGGAFVRTKLKSLDGGSVVDKTFRAGEKFARVRTEQKNMQYLYDSGDEVVFMDESTYEQLSLPHADLEDELPFMQPSSSVQVMFVGGAPSGVELPVVGRARGDRHRARREGRHRLERLEARDARDGCGRPGAALRERRRQDQGRPAREALHPKSLGRRSRSNRSSRPFSVE